MSDNLHLSINRLFDVLRWAGKRSELHELGVELEQMRIADLFGCRHGFSLSSTVPLAHLVTRSNSMPIIVKEDGPIERCLECAKFVRFVIQTCAVTAMLSPSKP